MKMLRSSLPCLLLLSLACDPASTEGDLVERCTASCERVRGVGTCAADSCIATCERPEVARCEAELDALLDCSETVAAEMLCGIERACAPENAAVGACLTASADAGVSDAAR